MLGITLASLPWIGWDNNLEKIEQSFMDNNLEKIEHYMNQISLQLYNISKS